MNLGRLVRSVRQRWRSLRGADRLDDDLRAEMAFHLEALAAELRESGLSQAEADRAARRTFGASAVFEEQARDTRGVSWLVDLWRDLVCGARIFTRDGRIAWIAILSLGFGIGANAAVLTTLNQTTHGWMPLAGAERLVVIRAAVPDVRLVAGGASVVEYSAWRRRARSFDLVGATLSQQRTFGPDREGRPAERVNGLGLTAELLTVLDPTLVVGRTLNESERRIVDPRPAVLLSESFWRRRFQGDPGIVGRTVPINGVITPIVGVVRQSFPLQTTRADFYVLLRVVGNDATGLARPLRVIARLRTGVGREDAQAELDGIAADLARAAPGSSRRWDTEIVPLTEVLYGWSRVPLLSLQVMVGCVFLIACANVAALLVMRTARRRREIAIRIAVGASRGRVTRALVTESLLLALCGGALGVFVSQVGVVGLNALKPPLSAAFLGTRFDLTSAAALLAFSVGPGIVIGLVPAASTALLSPWTALRLRPDTSTARRRHFLQGALVAMGLGLTLVALVVAGLLTKSTVRLATRDLGLDARRLVTFDVALTAAARRVGTYGAFPLIEVDPEPARAFSKMLSVLSGLTGIDSVAGSSHRPINGLVFPLLPVRPEGSPDRSGASRVVCVLVTPGFFSTVGASIVRGREIDARDGPSAPHVALVNDVMARRLWSVESAVGQHLVIDTEPDAPRRIVVGVVQHVPLNLETVEPDAVVYLPFLQQPARFAGQSAGMFQQMTFMVQPSADAIDVEAAIRQALASINPEWPLASLGRLDDQLAVALERPWYLTRLAVGLALTAGLVAAIGVYGVVGNLVGQREREIAVRRALGARERDIVALVAGRLLPIVGIALVSGLGIAFAVSRLDVIAAELWTVSASDPAVYIGSATLVAVAAAAASLPAVRRALSVDPGVSQRVE